MGNTVIILMSSILMLIRMIGIGLIIIIRVYMNDPS